MTQAQETHYPEFVGGAGVPASGNVKDAANVVVTQNDDQITSADGRKETEYVERRGQKIRRQPLATRHLDPDEMGINPEDGSPLIREDHRRYLVRAKYTFLYGKKLAYKGPCVVWLTDEEVKGQEHKVELLDKKAVASFAKVQGSKPVAIKENQSIKELKKHLITLYSQAEALKAELAIAEQREEAREAKMRRENPTVDLPDENLLADGVPVETAKNAVEQAKQSVAAAKDVNATAASQAATRRADALDEHVPSEDAAVIGDKSVAQAQQAAQAKADDSRGPGPGRPPGAKDKKPRKRRKLKMSASGSGGGSVDSPTGANPAG